MEWEITVHKNYIEIVTRGAADEKSSLKMAQAITDAMRSNRMNKALVDHRSLEAVTGHIIDIYERPRVFKIIGVLLGIKIAEVIKPEHQQHFMFLETVCINQGFQFSIFHEKDPALKWLLA
ncbi:MAG TPA: hypothetical protein VHP14_06035 [Anaerolineales bacterium]|nr:hypothetical protein [Anaerolineales bacterium]